jgi:hypothetical protein
MAKTRSHYHTHASYDPVRPQTVRAKTHPPSQAKIREMALNSHDGGRTKCDYCQRTFGSYYVALVRPESWLREPNRACRDCRKSRKLVTL